MQVSAVADAPVFGVPLPCVREAWQQQCWTESLHKRG